VQVADYTKYDKNNMTNEQTISWIFLSVALASQKEPADFNAISSIADGINHAVPTQKELQTSIGWLTSEGLIEKREKKYVLTDTGRQQFENASKDSNVLMTIWEKLEKKIASAILTNEKKMNNPSVQHVLNIYQTRLKMLEDGITNPAQEYKDIARTIVDKLSKMPPDEKIIWDDHIMKDSKGNTIVVFPKDK
jgi:hypothetical protein